MSGWSLARTCSAVVLAFLFSWSPATVLDAQNQSTAKPAPTNAPGAKPADPGPLPGAPLYVSPGVVQLVQQRLVEMGYPVPSVSGAWGETSAAALAQYQRKQGLDAGGDLDELTLTALGMPEVLRGDVPAGGDRPVSASAAATGGAPLSASPRLTRVIQHTLTQKGFPTHNVFGIWIREVDNAARNYQKASGLDITNTLDVALIHSLGLFDSLMHPQPGKLPTDAIVSILSDDTVLLTGAPISISAIGIRQVQSALQRRGHKEVKVNGEWSDATSAALKKFQEEQKLEPTGLLNLRTLKALGFTNPLAEIDRPGVDHKPTK
jgi:hypothetical protein